MFYKHSTFIKENYEIIDYNKIIFFRTLYTDPCFIKNMIASTTDHMQEKYGNLKINKERKIHLSYSSKIFKLHWMNLSNLFIILKI